MSSYIICPVMEEITCTRDREKLFHFLFVFQIPVNKYNFSEMKTVVQVCLTIYDFDKIIEKDQKRPNKIVNEQRE